MIVAISTPPGKGGIGIVRLSGDGCPALAGKLLNKPPTGHKASLRKFLDANHEVIDQGLVLEFAQPNSYTGEDVLELHCHGGVAVMRQLLERCLQLGARMAEPGEFTMRSFQNGKIDLTQAEAIADLINARTAKAAKLAVASMQGMLGRKANHIATSLLGIRSHLEAAIDFDDEDIQPDKIESIMGQIAEARDETKLLHGQCQQGSLWQSAVAVALVGPPNAGKSSLLNCLCTKDVAIVDEEPGTTRDVVSAVCDIHGMEMHIHDTAGLREAANRVEQEGIRRTLMQAEQADLVVRIQDASAIPAAGEIDEVGHDLMVHNKIDLTGGQARLEGKEVWLSAKTGEGIDLLRKMMFELCGANNDTEPQFIARSRHVEALASTLDLLEQASTQPFLPEQLAECLRLAHAQLGKITGQVSADDLLGEIFANFCIGK